MSWTQMESNRSIEDIDDALITDSVKKLLSDSDGNNYDLAADILSSNNNSSVNVSQLHSHSSGATVQEGMDLVDALDTLVQHLSRESNNNNINNKEMIDSNMDSNSLLLTAFDVVLLDHNYCQPVFVRPVTALNTTPITSQPIQVNTQSFQTTIDKQIVNSMQTSVPVTNTYVSSPSTTSTPSSPQSSRNNSNSGVKSPKTPTASRRSQRNIDKIEKSVLEKIKAENQEMLKREKESMESPNKITPKPEPIEDNKDDESELVIDLDNKKEKTNSNRLLSQKRPKKMKLHTSDESTNKKSRMENKQQIHDNSAKEGIISKELPEKQETNELDDVIAALSGVTDSETDKTPSSGRTQRTRRKPKRWDDDEVEVDFSGQLGGMTDEQPKQQINEETDIKVENKEDNQLIIDNKITESDIKDDKKVKENDTQLSSDDANNDDDEDSGSDFGSEDDPDKLWCVCRQPHNDRFMIGCDSCEEWFHGKCVNVTKLQGRQMEKAKQEWLCSTCTKGITDGMSREELKKTADQKRNKLEAEERIRAQVKRAAKDKFLKKEKTREITKIKDKKDKDVEEKKKEPKPDKLKNVPKKLQMPPKKRELNIKMEEEIKLKKLIKSSKKDLNKKQKELMSRKFSRESVSNKSPKSPLTQQLEPISKVVPIVRKPEVKKKHKDAIDPSLQDLFKAEPIKKTSITTPTTPTTPISSVGIPFHRKSTDRRTSTSTVIERLCPSNCGKLVKSDTSIFCNQDCIEVHVNETLKLLRIARKEKGEIGAKLKDIDRRVVVVEKSSGRLLSGKDGILEKEVLDYIKANPTFEVFRPSNVKDKKKDETHVKTTPLSPTKITPKKDEKKTPIGRSNSRSEGSEGSDPIRSNVKTSLKETLVSRCKEVNESSVQSSEITKIANKIEEELFKLFNKDTSGKYRNKYRSLIFNLKDAKNQGLFRKVVNGKISPERLVQMSAEELASSELAKWREREKISMLEMIKRDAAEKVNQVIVKKTHKGEELIETATVIESTNEPKIGDGKSTPVSAANTGVSTILDDLMGSSTVDTTSQHRTHLFSNNCRICTKQQLSDENNQEVVKKPLSHSSTPREEHSRPIPKRVRVELETANKILLEAAKLSSNAKVSFNADEDDSPEAPSSTLCLSSPEAPSSSSSSRPIWKGSVFMQDVAKFAANAVKVSGTVTDFLSQDVSEQITVCGRIAPEQVLDYVKKLKYSSRTEIGIIKFVSSREERVGYDAFFNYLDSRGRYGVVGSTGKLLKDFYILPLPKNGDVPEVLLPFDGPGLDKKSMRPNLLLGILIRSKKPIASQAPQTSSLASQSKSKTSNPSSNPTDRSYTPPPKNPSSQSSPDDNKDLNDVSYTPPRITPKTNRAKPTAKKAVVDDDEPYDPEEAELSNSNSLPSSTSSMQELMEQIAKSSNPVEMTSSVLSAIASSSNYELQRRLLEQLTAKVEEQKRQLEEQKLEAEAHFASNNSSNTSSVIPGLDGHFGSLKDIKIPDNLQDILSSVRQKTHEIEQQQERLKAVAASGFKFDDPIVKNFGTKNATEDNVEESIELSPEAEPMDLDEEVTPNKSNIIEVNTPLSSAGVETTSGPQTSDPRLRSKKQTPLPSISQETGGDSRVAAMTADELKAKAREQMAALAQMERTKDKKPSTGKIKIEWKKKK